jgi:hypothetical protein
MIVQALMAPMMLPQTVVGECMYMLLTLEFGQLMMILQVLTAYRVPSQLWKFLVLVSSSVIRQMSIVLGIGMGMEHTAPARLLVLGMVWPRV